MNPSFRPVVALILGLMLSPIGRAETTNVSVTIDVVNSKLPVISVTYGNNSRQLTLADDAAIEIDGKKSDYRALLPGDQAVVTYDKVKSAVTKIVVQRDAIAPAEALAEGWQEIDQRLIFLMIRLANVEASLEAIERAIDADSRKKSGKANTARKSDRDNEALDRKGGGPVKWSQFYGMTAEKFFYHPTDRNTTYHTETVLSQQGSPADNKVGGGVPAGQGLPVHQRPPQFDYIYRANDSAKARAELDVSELRGRIDALMDRRQKLEAEQAALWVESTKASFSVSFITTLLDYFFSNCLKTMQEGKDMSILKHRSEVPFAETIRTNMRCKQFLDRNGIGGLNGFRRLDIFFCRILPLAPIKR